MIDDFPAFLLLEVTSYYDVTKLQQRSYVALK